MRFPQIIFFNLHMKRSYLRFFLFIFLLCFFSFLSMLFLVTPAQNVSALTKSVDVDEDERPLFCQPKLEVDVRLQQVGLPLVGNEVQIKATNGKILLTLPDPVVPARCRTTLYPLQTGNSFQWQLVSKPDGSTAHLLGTSTLATKLLLDRIGEYKIKFTFCIDGCDWPLPNGSTLHHPSDTRELTIKAVDEIALPPETEPYIPYLESSPKYQGSPQCQRFSDILNPAFITIEPWHGPEDYKLLEGRVRESRVSRKDNFLNHSSNDLMIFIEPNGTYNHLRPSGQVDVEVEWETDYFPEAFWPTRGDRVSAWGYWINDCPHGIKTEIHPPVLVATHRARPILIPENEGYGSNIYVPGIMTDIYISQYAGECTSNCSLTGLHQPGGGAGLDFGPHTCLPWTEGYSHNPINREYEFRIYLPRNPQDILAEAGRDVPPVPLYYEVINIPSAGGDDPVIVEEEEDGIPFLKVTLNLTNYDAPVYSRRIVAAWIYPAPDNWNLKRWKLRISSIDVHNDGDSILRGDGDWRFWANTNNCYQEWTKIFDCDGCVHGEETFNGIPFETGSADPNHSLGPDLLLYPRQRIWLHTSGYEKDWSWEDWTGHVSVLLPQAPIEYSTRSQCQRSGGSGCCEYTLNYKILEGNPVGPANLSEAGQAIYDAYILTSNDGSLVSALPQQIKRLWNHPQDMEFKPGQPPVSLHETGFFNFQEEEQFSLHDMSIEDFQKAIAYARRERPDLLDGMLRELRTEMEEGLRLDSSLDFMASLRILKEKIPSDLWEQYFHDIKLQPSENVYKILLPWGWIIIALIVLSALFLGSFLLFLRFAR